MNIPDHIVEKVRTVHALRRVANGDPHPGDFDQAGLDPADWDDHVPDDETELYWAADDLAHEVVDWVSDQLDSG